MKRFVLQMVSLLLFFGCEGEYARRVSTAERMSLFIQENRFQEAADLLGEVVDIAERDSLTAVLYDAREAYKSEHLSELQQELRRLRNAQHLRREVRSHTTRGDLISIRSTTYTYWPRRVVSSGMYIKPFFSYTPGLDRSYKATLQGSIESDRRYDRYRLTCEAPARVVQGIRSSYSFRDATIEDSTHVRFEGDRLEYNILLGSEAPALLRLLAEGACKVWFQPYEKERDVRSFERKAAADVLNLLEIFQEIERAGFLEEDVIR